MSTSPRLGPLFTEQLRRVEHLRSAVRQLEDRYRVTPSADIENLERSIQRRTSKIDTLSAQLDDVVAQLVQLETERAGLLTGMELLLTESISTIRSEQGEMWAPWPILGYRIWGVTRTGLVGWRQRWTEPHLTAECEKLPLNPDVPHTDARCEEPQCGIYAAKRPQSLKDELPEEGGWAMGLVSLSGKVVEHLFGYRAAHARVEAIIVHHDGRVLVAEEPRLIDLAFSATVAATALLGEPMARWPLERTNDTLQAAERRRQCTLDADNE